METEDYVFETINVVGGKPHYQVRLHGEFVCYTEHKYSAIVDAYLKGAGFNTRREFLDYCWR